MDILHNTSIFNPDLSRQTADRARSGYKINDTIAAF